MKYQNGIALVIAAAFASHMTVALAEDSEEGKIRVHEASYGENCKASNKGNRTKLFRQLANGKETFDMLYDYRTTGGDPAYGCAKTLVIVYRCGEEGKRKTDTVPAEAGYNGKVKLSCEERREEAKGE